MDKLKAVPGYVKRFMFERGLSPAETVKLMNTLSDKARRDGILALEAEIEKIKDPFLVAGLKMAVDGTDEATIEQTLRFEVMAMQDRHKAGKKFFDLIKLYGPGYGLVATLIGQIGMFGNLGGDIEILGGMLAVAVVATMYGTVLANAVAGPMGDKLALRSSDRGCGRLSWRARWAAWRRSGLAPGNAAASEVRRPWVETAGEVSIGGSFRWW